MDAFAACACRAGLGCVSIVEFFTEGDSRSRRPDRRAPWSDPRVRIPSSGVDKLFS